MKCSNCGSDNAANTKFCTNCGTKLEESKKTDTTVKKEATVAQPSTEGSGIGWGFLGFFIPIVGFILFFVWKKEKPKSSKAAGIGALISFILGILFCILVFVIIGLSFSSKQIQGTITPNDNKESVNEPKEPTNKNNVYTIGDTFDFGDFEVRVGTTYTVETITKEYSSYKGNQVVKMPITIKNNGDETDSINSLYLKFFGPKGTELENNYSYEFDDGIGMAGDLRSGASYTKYLYYDYEGSGDYVIEFDDYENKIEVDFKLTE